LEQPGRTVGDIAARVRICENQVSEHLRALQARGLIQATRRSRWVHYDPHPDPLVPSARPLLMTLRRVFLAGAKDVDIIHALTAFTHPRRLAILCCLQVKGPSSSEVVGALTKISQIALWRHLRKLASRRLVSCDGCLWQLNRRTGRLEKTLLSLLSSGEG
jgi:predicted ArsR family transcriptional regulator